MVPRFFLFLTYKWVFHLSPHTTKPKTHLRIGLNSSDKAIYRIDLPKPPLAPLELKNKQTHQISFSHKVKKIWEDSLDSIPSPSSSVKIQILVVKFVWCVKAKYCWMLSINFWKRKGSWHHQAMFCIINSNKLSHQ